MSLRSVGGRSDGGIDLQGWWWLPIAHNQQRQRIRVFAQCKAEKKKIGPKYIRELEGVLHRLITPTTPSVALFISESQFSKETLLRAHSSNIPFFLLHIPQAQNQTIGSVIWNPALATDLLGGRIEARWEHSTAGGGLGRLGLWNDGKRIPSWVPDAEVDLNE